MLAPFALGSNDFVVIVHSEPEHYFTVWKNVVQKNAAYVGLLGSQTKAKILTERLNKDGVNKSYVKMLHAPSGLYLGAKTPEEIGINIPAEITKAKRKQ